MSGKFRLNLAQIWLGIGLATIQSFAAQAGCNKSTFRIVLDVGHSPAAPGAISARGVTEYSFNLRLAGVIERNLISHGYGNVFRIMTEGGGRNLVSRTARANSLAANLFLSVHHDSAQRQYLERWNYGGRERFYSDRFKGWSLFVSYSNPHVRESVRFAKLLADRLLALGLPFTTHHSEPIAGEAKTFIDASRGIYHYDGLTVLKTAQAPAVLMESGVIINREEEAALSSPARQNTIAEAVTEAVDGFCLE
jgi:N-acetylmuramoyl-L-alanine amidase